METPEYRYAGPPTHPNPPQAQLWNVLTANVLMLDLREPTAPSSFHFAGEDVR